MFLARFFQTFTVTLPDGYKIEPVQEGLTLKPKETKRSPGMHHDPCVQGILKTLY